LRISQEELRAQAQDLRESLAGHAGVEVVESTDMPVVQVPREGLVQLLRDLKERPGGFHHCSMVTAVDRIGEEPRFEVVYALYSVPQNRWLRVKTFCTEAEPEVPSATGVWPGANWLERECHDMFGIVFTGHPDLRRLLMPEGYAHHPLRKEFPRDGVEPDRLYREWDAGRKRPAGEVAPE